MCQQILFWCWLVLLREIPLNQVHIHVCLQSVCELEAHIVTNSTLMLSGYLKLPCPFKFAGSIPQALLFNSSDLEKWTYVSTVWIGNSTIGPRAEYV